MCYVVNFSTRIIVSGFHFVFIALLNVMNGRRKIIFLCFVICFLFVGFTINSGSDSKKLRDKISKITVEDKAVSGYKEPGEIKCSDFGPALRWVAVFMP